MTSENIWFRYLLAWNVNLDSIDKMTSDAQAAGVIPQPIERAQQYRASSKRLLDEAQATHSEQVKEAKIQAAMYAAFAMYESANYLYAATVEKRALRAGRENVAGSDKGAAKLKADTAKLHARWQARADKKWAEPQHKNKSVSAIATLIALPDEKPRTIRDVIKKKVGETGGLANR